MTTHPDSSGNYRLSKPPEATPNRRRHDTLKRTSRSPFSPRFPVPKCTPAQRDGMLASLAACTCCPIAAANKALSDHLTYKETRHPKKDIAVSFLNAFSDPEAHSAARWQDADLSGCVHLLSGYQGEQRPQHRSDTQGDTIH